MELKDMGQEDFKQIMVKLDKTDTRIQRIENFLLGDSELGKSGHVDEVQKLKHKVEQHSDILHDSFIERFNKTEERSIENEEKVSKIWTYGTVAVAIIVFLIEMGIKIIG